MGIINHIKNIYYNLPDWLLRAMAIVYYLIPCNMRYGKTFNKTLSKINEFESKSHEEISNYQDKKFLELLHQAYYHVPFYRKYYDDHGVDINSIHGIKDICKLPTIDKETVRQYANEMLADNVNKKNLIYVTTSGSTGNPVGFYQPSDITMKEWAYTIYIWSRVGYKTDSSRLVLRGKKLHPGCRGKNYFYDPLRRELSCNIFDLRSETMEEYCLAIERYKPTYIHGYMSAIIVLAKYISKRDKPLNHHFEAILATSENVVEEQKKYVEEVFNARVFSFYGHSERLIIAGQCEQSDSYHVEPTYGYCEIVKENNSARGGEIVATGFLNHAMPLIRYRTGDIAILNEEKCKCNKDYLLLKKIEGRWHQDMLINKDGAYVSLTALNIHSKEFDHIIRYKLIQEEKGVVEMRIQPLPEFTSSDSIKIKKLLEEKTNGKILFHVNLVDNIPIQSNGKYRIIEQKIEESSDDLNI